MIVMDRENLYAPGWSHVLSTTNDLAELDAFRVMVGAPPEALHLGNRRWPHLDLKLAPRELALASPEVRVFERTSDMLRYLQRRARSSGRVRRRVAQERPRRHVHRPSSTAYSFRGSRADIVRGGGQADLGLP